MASNLPASARPDARHIPLGRIGRAIATGFAVIGAGLTAWIVTGFVTDFSQFDQTRGGYEAPYIGWTGTPID